MKIAIYTSNLNGRAGIESVVREHLRIFGSRDNSCLVFGETGCDVNVPFCGVERQVRVRGALEKFAPDVCILHGVSHKGFEDDIAVLKSLGIRSVAVCHFSFPSAILLDGDDGANRMFYRGARQCDAVATVSEIDALWWRAMGIRSFHVQNPFVPPKKNVEHISGRAASRNVLWVGRPAQPKQPSSALAAFAAVVREVPDAHLTMIGGTEDSWEPFRKVAKKTGIEKNVRFLPARSDLGDLWAEADIHLLSSVTESFCLVLAEAKAWGIPTVMFEIPFLELVRTKKGILEARQGDVDDLAKQIVRMMSEPGLCERLSIEAKESLSEFNDNAVWTSWVNVFDALKSGIGGYDVSPELKTVVEQITFAWDNFCERNMWSVEFTNNWYLLFRSSFKPFAAALTFIVSMIRKLKSFV